MDTGTEVGRYSQSSQVQIPWSCIVPGASKSIPSHLTNEA